METTKTTDPQQKRRRRAFRIQDVALIIFVAFAIISYFVPAPGRATTTKQEQQAIKVTSLLLESSSTPQNDWTRNLLLRLDKVRAHCGAACLVDSGNALQALLVHEHETNHPSPLPYVKVNWDCPALLALEEIDAGDTTFPARPPTELQRFYDWNGAVEWKQRKIFREAQLGGNTLQFEWPHTEIEDMKQKAKQGTLEGTYGRKITNSFYQRLLQVKHLFQDKHILVIGSQKPWVEAMALALGAKHVTTLEYGDIKSTHSQISTETPASMRQRVAHQGKHIQPIFDGVISLSSLEHSGLGRYGDALNPWGDILAVARASCLSKPGAFFVLNVPTGKDKVEWNWHRIYGPLRMPLLMTNWKALPVDQFAPNAVLQDLAEKPDDWLNGLFVFTKV